MATRHTIRGLTNLQLFFKEHPDEEYYVKISRFRGDMETFKADLETYVANNPRLAPASFSGPEGEALLKFLGTETGRKVRRALLAQLEGSKPAPAAAPKAESQPAAAPSRWDPRRMY